MDYMTVVVGGPELTLAKEGETAAEGKGHPACCSGKRAIRDGDGGGRPLGL